MTPVTSAKHTANGNAAGLPTVPAIPLTEDLAVPADQSIGALVRDATAHMSVLVRAEVELARAEIAKEIKNGIKGSVFFIAALTILLFSSFFFFFFLADLLDIWIPRSLASGLVFLIMLVSAVGLAYLGYRKVRRIRGPRRTISTMKETAAVLRTRGEHAG
jgi:hypothetical protein